MSDLIYYQPGFFIDSHPDLKQIVNETINEKILRSDHTSRDSRVSGNLSPSPRRGEGERIIGVKPPNSHSGNIICGKWEA